MEASWAGTFPCGSLLSRLGRRRRGSYSWASDYGSRREACSIVSKTWLRVSPPIPTRTRAFSGPGPVHARHLEREEVARGKEARQHLQFVLATTDHLDDVLAALAFLKGAPAIDARRIAIVGHSFGGQLTLLAAERDNTIRAAVTFAAAADSCERSPELRERLRGAADKATVPIMLIQAANDYSTAPSQELANELERLHRAHLLKIYPAVGQTADDGHNFLYLAIPQWEHDVFGFLDEHVKH